MSRHQVATCLVAALFSGLVHALAVVAIGATRVERPGLAPVLQVTLPERAPGLGTKFSPVLRPSSGLKSTAHEQALPSHNAAGSEVTAQPPKGSLPIGFAGQNYWLAEAQDSPPQLLLPIEAEIFADVPLASGSLRLAIYVDRRGEVNHVEVISAVDPGGLIERTLVPWLREAPFSPAMRQGGPVNAVLEIDFRLAAAQPGSNTQASESIAGRLPKLDELGNMVRDNSGKVVYR